MNFAEALRIICGRCKQNMKGCKTCPVIVTVEEYDTDAYVERQLELIRNMQVKKVGNWYMGIIGEGYTFQVKVAEEDSQWGISEGRIIKLFVTAMPEGENPGREEIISYERGWGKYPDTQEGEELLDALYEYFQNHCEEEV